VGGGASASGLYHGEVLRESVVFYGIRRLVLYGVLSRVLRRRNNKLASIDRGGRYQRGDLSRPSSLQGVGDPWRRW